MARKNTLERLLVHCQGEIGKVIVGGAPAIPGAPFLDKLNDINDGDFLGAGPLEGAPGQDYRVTLVRLWH